MNDTDYTILRGAIDALRTRLDFVESRLSRLEGDYLERRTDPRQFVPGKGASVGDHPTGLVTSGKPVPAWVGKDLHREGGV